MKAGLIMSCNYNDIWCNNNGEKIIEIPMEITLANLSPESKYDWLTQKLLDYVRDAKSEKDAVENIKLIIAEYKNQMSLKETFKLFIKKLMK